MEHLSVIPCTVNTISYCSLILIIIQLTATFVFELKTIFYTFSGLSRLSSWYEVAKIDGYKKDILQEAEQEKCLHNTAIAFICSVLVDILPL